MDELCHFLGLTGYYKRFTPLFSNITKPLNSLLKRGTKFKFSAECQSAFEHLKTLCVKPILQDPYTEKP